MNWELPETHRQVLAALARRPPPELDEIDADVLEELRRWGMVMERSLEVTGMGRYAAAEEQELLCTVERFASYALMKCLR